MSPYAALHDHAFRVYALLASIVLASGGLVLLVLATLFQRDVRPVWLTYRSWLLMVPLVFACVLAGRWAVIDSA